jgi:geranylgeranyl transferase type-1 subunit beta
VLIISKTYEGGIGESSRHESHGKLIRHLSLCGVLADRLLAGYTYTAIASLAFLDRLPDLQGQSSFGWKSAPEISKDRVTALTNIPGTIRWLLSRQLAYSDEEEGEGPSSLQIKSDLGPTEVPSLAGLSLNEAICIGFNGRANKLADTCYCFWVPASLEVLGQSNLIDSEAARRFLLEETQHRIGGFGKQSGYPPDLYHSYLGLATLAMMKEPGLKKLDPVLCASTETREKMEKAIKEAVVPWKPYWKHGEQFVSLESDPKHAQNMAEDEGPPKFMMDILQKIGEQKS